MNITTKINNIISKTNEHISNIKHYKENTYPEWIADNGSGTPFAYDKFTAVKYTDGNIYYSLVDSNTEEPTTGSNWSQFPITPSSVPTTDYQVANKKYVDDNSEPIWVANDSRAKTALNASGNAPIYACRAWVNFNGTGTVAIRASGNVSSITDNGTGDYTVNFITAMPDANYAASGASQNVIANTTAALFSLHETVPPLTTSCRILSKSAAHALSHDKEVITFLAIR